MIDGRAVAAEMLEEAATQVKRLARGSGAAPGLAAVLVGDDPASQVYVRNKARACGQVGMLSQTFALPGEASEQEVVALVERLNSDRRFHGVLVQLPLPAQIRQDVVAEAIAPEKDVDGLNPLTLGRLIAGRPGFVPATPLAIQELLVRAGYDPGGRHVVVCGRSELVGKPLALLLMQKAQGANATVTVCHTGTPEIGGFTRQGDILVAAIGKPRFVTASMVKGGAVVIDVGINRLRDPSARSGYRLVGDVDFEGVSAVASAITPVPGGVGPVTVASLIANTVKAAAEALEGSRAAPAGGPP